MSASPSLPTSNHVLTTMTEGRPATHDAHDTFEEAMAQARAKIAEATRLPFHNKTLVIVSDDQSLILWAAASDGWETDYRPGSSPEMH